MRDLEPLVTSCDVTGQEAALARVHYELVKGLIERSACPSVNVLAQTLDAEPEEVEKLLGELSSIHGVVLHPHVCAPWVVHPFSTTPTINWIVAETGSWWAPCIWCALGVTVLVGGNATVHTRYGAEAESAIIEVVNGRVKRDDVVVHFAIPPARAWDNVHQHCSLVLPFHSSQGIKAWCLRYGIEMGEAVPINQVSALAQAWYGSHASPHWRKWTVQEAEKIFNSVGLTSEFWQLSKKQGHF